ncbi:xylitol dehydrogenase [Histoplasma capsulatum var. duboisii H88]|uniref:Xylitol dehydrogenase n=1 Tax=Ajellomyces capsulatus (strain H88) TaxID=544711 RepID=F0UG22_AJEC8|nr:xylitol dehydrogenase [Histoplasma capsulatum var. duboisii H88]QSS55008.1 xylitol dehydrogenase [Histoplasma capsulatum var. duboisii H88]
MSGPNPQHFRALVLHGAKDLRLEVRQASAPQPGELQIAVRVTGLCGSDLHYYQHGRNGDFIMRAPLCLGHESAGTITAVGIDVRDFQVGDRVALEVGFPCTSCAPCIEGRYNICRSLRFRSSAKTFPHLDGTLMELTNHPADKCHKLPAHISDVQSALIEPLAVCMHAIRRSNPADAESVARALSATRVPEETAALIFGAGAIGMLLTAALAATQHFSTLVVADIDEARLRIAASLPFPLAKIRTYLLPKPASEASPQAEEDLAQQMLSAFCLPNGFSRTYDCTGVASCIRMGIYATGPGGAVVQIGMGGASHPNIPLSAAALREVDLIGVFRYAARGYPDAVALMGSEKFQGVAEKVATHFVRFEEGDRAFELAAKGVDEQGKPVVKVIVVSGREAEGHER